MQISDLIGQYNNSMNAGSRIAGGVKGMSQVADTVNKLSAGQLFEGTVTGTKGGNVTLSLSNGQAINARLAGDVNLIEGESVFFEVKSNDGNTINICPVSMGTMNNPTLLSALDAANLPVSENSLNMVTAMMSEQMSIDSKALGDMAKLMNAYPNTDVSTLATMTRLDMDVSPEMIEQFEHYKAGEGQLMDSVSELANAFIETMADPNVTVDAIKAFQENLIQVIDPEAVGETADAEGEKETGEVPSEEEAIAEQDGEGDNAEAVKGKGVSSQAETTTIGKNALSGEIEETAATKDTRLAAGSKEDARVAAKDEKSAPLDIKGEAAEIKLPKELTLAKGAENEQAFAEGKGNQEHATKIEILPADEDPQIAKLISEAGEDTNELPQNAIGHSLSDAQIKEFSDLLKDAKLLPKDASLLDAKGNLSSQADATKLLNDLVEQLSDGKTLSKDELMKILSSDGFKGALRSAMQNKWTLAPEKIADKDQIKQLYADIEKDIAKIADEAAKMTKADNPLSSAAKQMHNNIEFMNQVNETYAYVQLPLKLAGQQATGDLYVFSNKKRLNPETDEISAFLHFDLEHLGSTDISIKMYQKKVDTKFFMADDAAFDLIEKNLPVLEEKLNKLGYDVKLTIEGGEKPVDFVQDFLRQESVGTGPVTRYSFDMRA